MFFYIEVPIGPEVWRCNIRCFWTLTRVVLVSNWLHPTKFGGAEIDGNLN